MRVIVFGLPVECADCAGPLHIVQSRAIPAGTQSIAILECSCCTSQWEVEILLRRHRRSPQKGPLRVAG